MNGSNLQFLVMGFGVMILALSSWGVLKPGSLVEWVRRVWTQPWSLWLAIGIRLLLGWALLQAAPFSRCPLALNILGWVAIAAAVLLLAVGKARISRLLDWGLGQPPLLMRLWCLAGVAFGVFLVWAVA